MNSECDLPVLLVSLKDAAARLSVSKRTLEREIVRGRFPQPVKIGSLSRVPVAAVQAYLTGLQREAISVGAARMRARSAGA